MNSLSVKVLASAALLALSLTATVAADDSKPITIDLKTFKFSGGPADLLGYSEGEEKLFLYTFGKAEAKFKVPAAGEYEIIIRSTGDAAMNEGAKFKLAIDDKPVGKETEVTADDRKEYKFPTTLKPGEHSLVIEFTNDIYKEGEYDRNLYIHGVALKKK